MNYLKYTRKQNKGFSPLVNILLLVLRLIFGGLFVFSGFVKLIDPLGFSYKIQEYLGFFGGFFEFLTPLSLVAAVTLCVAELAIGLNIIFNIRFRLSTLAGLLFMLVMTPLTLYIAVVNPVSDCGCFGDALTISNTATFVKNVFLLLTIIVLFIASKKMRPVFTPFIEWIITAVFVLIGTGFALYNLRNLPVIDFRPFKVGVNILDAMTIPEGALRDEFDFLLIYEKNGVQKEFTLENFPRNDSTWVFVDQKIVLISQGYQPKITNFIIENEHFDDITEDILTFKGNTYLVIMYDINSANERAVINAQKLYERTLRSENTRFYALTGSSDSEIEELRNRTGITYPFAKSDPTMLKTIIRANPGIVLLKNGTIEAKWHWRNFNW
jgi:uncharacterized membrane protein YphA (DoxX/SURF4 family)